jgi:hypothetical protein
MLYLVGYNLKENICAQDCIYILAQFFVFIQGLADPSDRAV